jgi:hypothetical protein
VFWQTNVVGQQLKLPLFRLVETDRAGNECNERFDMPACLIDEQASPAVFLEVRPGDVRLYTKVWKDLSLTPRIPNAAVGIGGPSFRCHNTMG